MNPRERIVTIIAGTLKIPAEGITDQSKLIDLAPDSIALFELLVNFETALGQHIQYDEIAHVETVGDIVTYVGTFPAEVLSRLQSHRVDNYKDTWIPNELSAS